MSNSFELNSISLKNDGIIIYQRPDIKSRNWQARIRVPDAKGYVIKSLGTPDVEVAKIKAEEMWDNLRLKVKSGGSLKSPKLIELYPKFVHWLELNSKSEGRVVDIRRVFDLYFLEYFKDKDVFTFKTSDIQEFVKWRISNPKVNKATKKSVKPTNSTIKKELIAVKRFFKWCKLNGHIKAELEIDTPSSSPNRRPHFNHQEWHVITRNVREWVKDERTQRDRTYMTQYMLVLANTGIRVGEARDLRWTDIENQIRLEHGKEVEDTILWVNGKTGKRDVVAKSADVFKYFKTIYEMRCKEVTKQSKGKVTKPPKNEYVFCNQDGTPIHSFKKGFASYIKHLGLTKDEDGNSRTIYSLRHTYATFRLMNGVDVYVLSKNLGTSIKMIEQHYGHTTNRGFASELTKDKSSGNLKKLPWE